MSSVNVVPDSSFYICFLDDINAPHYLLQLLNARIFKFIFGKIIKNEIEKSSNYKTIEKTIDSRVEIFEYYNHILLPKGGSLKLQHRKTRSTHGPEI